MNSPEVYGDGVRARRRARRTSTSSGRAPTTAWCTSRATAARPGRTSRRRTCRTSAASARSTRRRSMPGGAYVAVKKPLLDDFAPYIFRTHDFGKTWTKIVTGIPRQRLRARRARGSDAPRPALRRHAARRLHLVRRRRPLAVAVAQPARHAGRRHLGRGERPRDRHARPRLLHPRQHRAAAPVRRRSTAAADAHLFKPADAIRARRTGDDHLLAEEAGAEADARDPRRERTGGAHVQRRRCRCSGAGGRAVRARRGVQGACRGHGCSRGAQARRPHRGGGRCGRASGAVRTAPRIRRRTTKTAVGADAAVRRRRRWRRAASASPGICEYAPATRSRAWCCGARRPTARRRCPAPIRCGSPSTAGADAADRREASIRCSHTSPTPTCRRSSTWRARSATR